MYHVSQLPQLLPVVFVQPQTQTWIKEADEKNAKMQDICNKETKTTAASLLTFLYLKFSIWSGDGRAVGWCWVNFQCRGVLLIWVRIGQGTTGPAVGASGGCLDIFLSSIISLFFLPLSGRQPDID